MTQSTNQARRTEGGFTLVELAIVMIIIGLLIGGILKGQELITNARVSATVAQAKAVESGISGFRDKYAGMPGDIGTAANPPNTRIPNCSNICNTAGNGDGLVQLEAANNNPGIAATTAASEGKVALPQLSAAGFIGGVQSNFAATAALTPGTTNPTTPLGGAWQFGYHDGTAAIAGLTAANTGAFLLPAGHYIASVLTLGTALGGTNTFMTPVQAAAIDRKLDDGTPNGGSVRAAGAATCAAALANSLYLEANGGAVCGLIVKVQ